MKYRLSDINDEVYELLRGKSKMMIISQKLMGKLADEIILDSEEVERVIANFERLSQEAAEARSYYHALQEAIHEDGPYKYSHSSAVLSYERCINSVYFQKHPVQKYVKRLCVLYRELHETDKEIAVLKQSLRLFFDCKGAQWFERRLERLLHEPIKAEF